MVFQIERTIFLLKTEKEQIKQQNNEINDKNLTLCFEKEIINDELIKLSTELVSIKTKNFNLQHDNNDIMYKNKIYSQIINELNKKITKNNNASECGNEKVKEKKEKMKNIDYHKIPELTITNMINILIDEYGYKYYDIKDYHSHVLKVLINRNQSRKLERKLERN